MKVLGISNTKDSGACLLIDGELVAAVNEERLNREKLTREFPIRSIEWILRTYSLKAANIDAIGLGAWKGIESYSSFPLYANEIGRRSLRSAEIAKIINNRIQASIKSDSVYLEKMKEGIKNLNLNKKPIFQCHHHFAHQLTAFEFSPFEKALVVTLDGRGDFLSGSVYQNRKGQKPILIREELEIDSLGAFYGWITNLLGFTADRHEGKITGLAAAGDPAVCRSLIKQMITYQDGKIIGKIGQNFTPFMRGNLPALNKKLSKFSREDVAAATQEHLENIVVQYVKRYLAKTGEKFLCLAGGIFANVLLNYKLQSIPGLKGCFVFPHMGDGGISAGGAIYGTKKLGGSIVPLKNAYLGPEFSETECMQSIKSTGLKYSRPENLAEKTADLIQKGLIIGLFQGKMEYGPRALGNRSIITAATNAKINETLNRRLARSEFMPFAPVTMFEHAKKCYVGWTPQDVTSLFMTSCFACTEAMCKQTPAVVHLDGTARPQIIRRKDNLFYHSILENYFKKTGIPTLINTSFNEHEAPIVCTPAQALSVLTRKGIDALIMPPFLVQL